jgi:RNA polymerase sigma-70 factor (ECF subfamily)
MERTPAFQTIDVEDLYRRYGPMVLRRCRQLLRNEDLAADAMQDTFVKVLRSQSTLHGRYPSSLLYCIATNVCLNMLRSQRRRPAVSADLLMDTVSGAENMEERVLDACLVEQAFQGAREGTRIAAEMLYVEGRTLAETAERVSLSVSGVRKRLRSLREQRFALLAR